LPVQKLSELNIHMASDSTECPRRSRSRALAGSSQKAEANTWVLPLLCQSSRDKTSRTQKDLGADKPGADKPASHTRLPLLQPRRNEKDPNHRMKSSASKPSVRDSPSRIGLCSPPAWSEKDFQRAQPSVDKAEFILQRRSLRNASSATRLEPLQHSALTRLGPLQKSAPQLPNLDMRTHEGFAAKEIYSRGSSVFGSHFAACSSAPSSANFRSHSLGAVRNSTILHIETASDAQTVSSTAPTGVCSDLSKIPNEGPDPAQVGIACGSTTKDQNVPVANDSAGIEAQERVAKEQAVSEMHRLFAEEAARGGSPTGNAVKALRRLAEAGEKNGAEMSQRSRSCPCSASAQSSRATSQRESPDPTAVQPTCH
jgi:hypothetical protein